MAVKNSIDLERDSRSIIGSRVLDAPRALVFSVWTDPKHLAQWWGPNGFATTTHAYDFRPGGVWRFVMHGPDGRDYQNRITFDEIIPPKRIVYRHDGGDDVEPVQFTQTVTFEDLGNGKTLLTSGTASSPPPKSVRASSENTALTKALRRPWRDLPITLSRCRQKRVRRWLARYDSARNAARRSSGWNSATNRSIEAWVSSQSGNALARSDRPLAVIVRRRLRLSSLSTETFTSLRRSRGLRTAVNVVRSIASKAATLPMVGGSGRFSDISREN